MCDCLQIAAEIAAPLSKAKKITMISSGKGDVGAQKLTGEVMDIMDRIPLLVENMTSVNISKVSRLQNQRLSLVALLH